MSIPQTPEPPPAHPHNKPTGQALHDGQYIDAHFTRSFYKHMLGQVRARPPAQGPSLACTRGSAWGQPDCPSPCLRQVAPSPAAPPCTRCPTPCSPVLQPPQAVPRCRLVPIA